MSKGLQREGDEMNASATRISSISRRMVPLVFLLGLVLLLATWGALYWSEALFTESHLVGYYCCVSDQDLPAIGTLERTISDFFGTSLGKHLPSLLFISIIAAIFLRGMRKKRGNVWLPFLFVLLGLLYLVVDFWLINISWSISNSLVGPQTSAYKGYHRTWYGIALHLILWAGFFFALTRVSIVGKRT
jgi:hypothetical protein